MDTRQKILTPQQAVACAAELRAGGVPFKAVSGYFDILQAPMVRSLQKLSAPGTRLFALVSDPEHSVTTANARSELAASLRVIDYVVHCQTDPGSLVRQLQPEEWIREEVAHLAGTERLIQHVLERHGRFVSPERSH